MAILILFSHPANAQTAQNYGFGILFGTAHREDNRTGTKESMSGITVGLEGFYTVNRFIFDLRYLQGGLSGDRDLIEGELFVGTHVLPWLRVKLGRHIRTIIVGEVTERWSTWDIRFRTEGEVFAPESQAYGVHAYGELWMALTGSADIPNDFGSARGVEGGFVVRLSGSPFNGRVGYRVDRANQSGGPRLENIQEFTIGIGWGR